MMVKQFVLLLEANQQQFSMAYTLINRRNDIKRFKTSLGNHLSEAGGYT